MKKILSIVLAALLVVGVFAGCAKQNSLPEKATVPAQGSELASKQAATQTSGGVLTSASAAYEKLIAYKTEDYQQQSVADFNAALASTPEELTEFLAAAAEVISTISPDDENYDFFTTTISLSDHELYCEHMGEDVVFFIDLSKQSRLCDYLDEEGEPVYEFNCFVEMHVPYSIDDPKLVTVAERDNAFLTFKEEMQRYLNSLSEEEAAGGNIKTMLTDKSAELAKSLSTGGMKLSPCEIYMIEISGEAESSIGKEAYQKLSALQFDDYWHMTVSDFQDKVWTMTDSAEYRNLLERLSQDEALYRLKDSDEAASFLFYILEPLTAEKWQTRDFSGAAESNLPAPAENATLEYTFTLNILNADKLMVKDYNDTRLGVISMMQDVLKNKTKEELGNKAFMLADIQAYLDDALQYMQAPELRVDIDYAYFPLPAEDDSPANEYPSDSAEQRRCSNGTDADYRSLLALKTPNYQNRPLADFNSALLEWANENHETMEKISEDTVWNDFKVPLDTEELSFVKLTVFLSGMENGKAIQSIYAGQTLSPYYDEELPQKTASENGKAAWCSLYYRFSYSISDANAVTVGSRDRQIGDMINAVQDFWESANIESLLKMSEADIAKELEKIASEHSISGITITIDKEQLHFEHSDAFQPR